MVEYIVRSGDVLLTIAGRHGVTVDQIRDAISELGFTPRQRNVRYELVDESWERLAIEANRKRDQAPQELLPVVN
jgi:cyclic dehypoxanthinyl futalosine synthase